MTDTGLMGGKNVLADVIGLFSVDVTVVVAFPGADPLADLADLVCICWETCISVTVGLVVGFTIVNGTLKSINGKDGVVVGTVLQLVLAACTLVGPMNIEGMVAIFDLVWAPDSISQVCRASLSSWYAGGKLSSMGMLASIRSN